MSKNFIKFPNPFAYFVYKRTYAREMPNGKTEEWGDTINRIIKGCKEQLKVNLNHEEELILRSNMSTFKASVAGRYLWVLGTPIIEQSGFGGLMNCCYMNVDNIDVFHRVFHHLLLGTGVGFGVQRRHIDKLPLVIDKNITIKHHNTYQGAYMVQDTREGWVELLKKVINSYFVSGESFFYNTTLIRPKGQKLKTFGGLSSGDEELILGINKIIDILNKNKGLKLKDNDIVLLICTISRIVVAGNTRRSALISIGDSNSYSYLTCKRWSNGNIDPNMAYVNMTCEINDINDILDNNEFWANFEDGEAYGFFNRALCNTMGRIGEYKTDSCDGLNPCGEMNLSSGEVCNLAEVCLSKFETYNQLKDIMLVLYKICKHAYILPCHDKQTEEICKNNFRIGLSVSGYLESTEEQKGWLKDIYKEIDFFDNKYTNIIQQLHPEFNFKPSIKLTTIKPSGTLSSAIFGTLSYGAHPSFSKYLIRRVRVSYNHPLVNICKKAGYKVYPDERFDGTFDKTTSIVEFYLKAADNAVIADEVDAISQLETIKRLQKEWSDNSVSVSIYYTPEEIPKIKEYLKKNYNNNFKSLSFLMKYNHGFKNAPLEAITKEQYEEYIKDLKELDLSTLGEEKDEDIENIECAGGSCPVR